MNRKFDAKVRKVGNSYVVTIPKSLIKRFNIKEGKFLTIDVSDEE